MNNKYFLICFVLCICGGWKARGLQQVLPADSVKVVKDSLKKNHLDEVAITIVRAERGLPVSETLLNKSDIEKDYVGQEMPVILGRSPSVTWYSDGGHYTGYSYVRIRGIDQTRINFTMNGVPLNEPEDQGAYFSNYPDFLNSVGSIQVQRGVGLSSNGTASFGGSVNMESPSLYDSAYVELTSSYGSYATYKLSPEFNTGPLKNRWTFYGRYSNAGSNGFREHSGIQGQSFFFSGAYLAKKGIVKFTNVTGTSKNQMSYLAVADSTLKRDYRENPLSRDEKDEFKQSLSMLQYVVPLSRYSFLNTSAYYTYLQGGYGIAFGPDLYNYSVKSDFLGGFVNYQYKKDDLKVNVGIHANTYKRDHYAFIEPYQTVLLYKNTGQKEEFSSFLKVAYDINRLTLFADVQYRTAHFKYTSDPHQPINPGAISWKFINPKAGISYALKQNQVVYASVAKTGREPTRNDLFAGYDNLDSLNYLEVGSLNRVKPESVVDIEAGIKLNYRRIKCDVNVYNMRFKNEIAAIGQLSYIGLPLRKNVESSYRRGIELSLILIPIDKLSLSTQANFSDNKIKTYSVESDSITYKNVSPLLTPQVVINQMVDYSFTSWLKAGVGARYQSECYLDNSNRPSYTVPSSLILNASLSFVIFKVHSLNFMVNNLSNQKYYTSGYVQGTEAYYFAMAQRNYFVSLKLRF